MNRWIKWLLSVLQIGGGFLGFTLILQSIVSIEMTPILAVLNVFFSLIFIFGIVAGLVLNENDKLGIQLSLIYQGIQILIISSPFIVYSFSSGFLVSVSVQSAEFGSSFRIGSHYYLYLFDGSPWGIGVNLVALLLFIYLLLKIRYLAKQEDISKLSSTTEGVSM